MINNGRKRKIGCSGNLPNMGNTLLSWFQPICLGLVKSEVVDYEKVESINYVDTQGVVQPPRPETIEIQPEGIRNWEWLEIHCLPDIDLKVNEYIYYNDLRYKVMQREDFKPYGYMHYLILEAYRNERAS